MPLTITPNLSAMRCVAGEAIIIQCQLCDAAGVPEDHTGRSVAFLFYNGSKREHYQPSEIKTDATGQYFEWVNPGTLSTSLYALNTTFKFQLAERLDDGINDIARGTLTIEESAPDIEDLNTAPIARYVVRITRKNDPATINSPVFSVATARYNPAASPLPSWTAQPSITGTTTSGQMLTGQDGTIANGSVTGRQWLRGGVAISGATSNTLLLVSADEGQTISFRVTATGSGGTNIATSPATATIAAPAVPAPAFTVLPSATGTGIVGQTLTASDGTISNGSVSGRQWMRDGSPISGATDASYLLVSADEGKNISVRVTATGPSGSTSATSNAIAVSAAPVAPSMRTAPVVSGSGVVGQSLTSNTGLWTSSPTSYAYQWLRDGAAISGATASTYTITSDDQGKSLVARVVASNATGASAPATSNSIAVAAAPQVLAISRPAANIPAWNLWGDSTMFGVGSQSGDDISSQMRNEINKPGGTGAGSIPFHGATLASTTSNAVISNTSHVGNGGNGGQTTPEIAARIVSLGANQWGAEMSRGQYFGGGLNNYVVGGTGYTDVNLLIYGKRTAELIKLNLQDGIGAIKDGKPWLLNTTMYSGGDSSGGGGISNMYPTMTTLKRELVAQYGSRAVDLRRLLVDEWDRSQSQTSDVTTAGPDYWVSYMLGNVPPSLRPANSNVHAVNNAPVYFYTANPDAAPPSLAYDEGQIAFNTYNSSMRKKEGANGAGSWLGIDDKHFNARANKLLAEWYIQTIMAVEGSGPPFATPQEIFLAQNAVNNSVVGTIKFLGTPTAVAITADRAGLIPSTEFSCDASGTVRKIGSVSEGYKHAYIWTTNALGTLRSILDIYVGRATGSTSIPLFTTPGSLMLHTRANHNFGTANKMAYMGYVRPDVQSGYLFYIKSWGAVAAGASQFYCRMNTGGRVYLAGADSTGTLFSSAFSPTTPIVAAGAWSWVALSFDFDAGTYNIRINEQTATGSLTPRTMDFQRTVINFLGDLAPASFREGTSTITGGFGPQMLFNDYIDFSQNSVCRQVFAADGTPVQRAGYSAVGGFTPKFDITGLGIGELTYGATSPNDPANFIIANPRAKRQLGYL